MIPSKYKIFFLVLSICACFSACQTAVDKQQQAAEQNQLQSQLDKVTKELDSLKKAAESSKADTPSKKKKKPSPTPKVHKKEPDRKVVSTPKPPTERSTTNTTIVTQEPTIVSSTPVTIPSMTTSRSNEIDALKTSLQQERQSMLQAKEAAQSADAPNWASESYEEAIATEQMGEDNAQQLNSTALKEAKTNFATASSLFQQATEKAEQVVAEKTEADQAKSAMLAMRRSIGNGSRNPSNVASYKEALVVEKQGDEAYDTYQFVAATEAYMRAEILYKSAKETIARKVEKVVGNNKLIDTKKVEERTIKILIENYGQLLEVGDMQGLLQERYITAKERNAWSTLFKNVENITVKISNQAIDVKGNKATANFFVKMFYENSTNNKIEENNFPKSWQLEKQNGKWFIANR